MTKQKEEALKSKAPLPRALANTRFRVEIEGGHIVMAHVAGRMRKHFIRIVPGDRVRVELPPTTSPRVESFTASGKRITSSASIPASRPSTAPCSRAAAPVVAGLLTVPPVSRPRSARL